MERLFRAARAHHRMATFLPTATYIGTSLVILAASGPWTVSAGGWEIYVGAVLWTLLLLVGAVVFIKKASTVELASMAENEDTGPVLAAKVIGYFLIVLAMRQLMIWKFYNPWEKLPLVFLVLLQVAVVEGTRLDDVGLHGWGWRNGSLALILAGVEIVLLNVGAILIYVIAYGIEVTGNFVPCLSCQLYWLSFPYQFLAVGFGEELFFRGYVYTRIRTHIAKRSGDKASYWGSMAITNALFGLFHVAWYVGNWLEGDFSFDLDGCIIRVAGTAVMGLGFTYLYEKTGSLVAPMLAHGFGNSIQPLVGLLGLLPPRLPWGTFVLQWDHVFIGIALFVAYIGFTRWFVRVTGGRHRPPPWLVGGEQRFEAG
ncbi:MAG: CPBP family intramembrane metalloprotease [Candidatus Lokiarchaeota archaeon]|nr:CPBP family intramembrane metalloprotease [Candidatus Lokiarchaeota archaeon]